MIYSRQELKRYIILDRAIQPIAHPFLSAITFSESWSVRRYLTVLRHLDYHKNMKDYLFTKKKLISLTKNKKNPPHGGFFYWG